MSCGRAGSADYGLSTTSHPETASGPNRHLHRGQQSQTQSYHSPYRRRCGVASAVAFDDAAGGMAFTLPCMAVNQEQAALSVASGNLSACYSRYRLRRN